MLGFSSKEIKLFLISLVSFFAVALIILFIMLVLRTGNEGYDNQIKLIQARLKRLEDKIVKLEEVNERLAKIEQLGQEISMLKDRLNRLETSITHNDAKVSKKATKTRYHQVLPGQTLWGTSRRYGLTVEELRKLNGLAPGAVIHPGQKLIVSPANNK